MRTTKPLPIDDTDYGKTDRKSTSTAFVMLFPTLILAGIAAFYAPFVPSLICIALAIYQFLLSSKFIKDYYRAI